MRGDLEESNALALEAWKLKEEQCEGYPPLTIGCRVWFGIKYRHSVMFETFGVGEVHATRIEVLGRKKCLAMRESLVTVSGQYHTLENCSRSSNTMNRNDCIRLSNTRYPAPRLMKN